MCKINHHFAFAYFLTLFSTLTFTLAFAAHDMSVCEVCGGSFIACHCDFPHFISAFLTALVTLFEL